MGETYGSTWTVLLYMLMIGIFFSFIIMGIEVVSFWSGKSKIEDGLKEGDWQVFETLSPKFYPCDIDSTDPNYPIVDTTENCSGVTEIDLNSGYIGYQIAFKGLYVTVDASSEMDFKANLSY